MSTQIKIRRGSDSEHKTFTGAVAELTYDTTNNDLRTHDGAKLGGHSVSLGGVARSLNVESEAVTFGTVGGTLSTMQRYMYVKDQQVVYGIPTTVANGEIIVSVVGTLLTTDITTHNLLALRYDFDTVVQMQSHNLPVGASVFTRAFNVPVNSQWLILPAAGVDDFSVAIQGGKVAVLVVGEELNPKELGLHIDGVTVDDWVPVFNFVYPTAPTFTRGGVDYHKAKYPIKFLGRSFITGTQKQNKITITPTVALLGFSLSGAKCGLGYAVARGLGQDFPMLSGFIMAAGQPADTVGIELIQSPSHYLGYFSMVGEEGVTVGIRRELSANGRLECLDLAAHKTGMYNQDAGITRATQISASFCTVGGVRNITSGDSDWLQCYFNTNGVDYTGSDFVTGAGITFESQSSNCNYSVGKSEYNAKGLVIIDSLGINVDGISWDANRLGSIHIYNNVDGLPQNSKSINIGSANRFLSGGQEVGDGKDSQIYIETKGPIDININGSFRKGGTLAYDDNTGDITRPVGPLKAAVKVKYLGVDVNHELNITLNGDMTRCSEEFTVSALSSGAAAKLKLTGNPTRNLVNNFFGLGVENNITLHSKGHFSNNGTLSFGGLANIKTAVRTGVGETTLTFEVPYDDALYSVQRGLGAAGYASIAFKSATVFTFQTRNPAGVLTDMDFDFSIN